MRLTRVLLLGPLLPAAGCNLFSQAGHNVANERISIRDERKLDRRLTDEAKVVWCEVCRQFPARTFTPEFADGFTDGYVDYLDVGGVPGPPAVPPLRYRRSSYLTPHGHALVRDYMVGFQYGADVAVATGKRQFLTVPVLLPEAAPTPPLNVARLPTPPEASLDAPGSVPKPAPVPPPDAPPPVPLDGPKPAPVVPPVSVPPAVVPPPVPATPPIPATPPVVVPPVPGMSKAGPPAVTPVTATLPAPVPLPPPAVLPDGPRVTEDLPAPRPPEPDPAR